MAPKGGKQPGAGRPKGAVASHTLDAALARARMVELINHRIDDLVRWLFEKAYQVDEHGRKVYDVAAIKELMDRGYGRPAQAIDLTSKGESLVPINPQALALSNEYEEKLKKGL